MPYKIVLFINKLWPINGGEGEIRTHGALAGTPVFKTGTLNHSVTSPHVGEGIANLCWCGKASVVVSAAVTVFMFALGWAIMLYTFVIKGLFFP